MLNNFFEKYIVKNNFKNFENPLKGYSVDFQNFLMRNPNIFSRKALPIFWPTSVYGFGKCLRAYTGWPEFLPIPVYLDHGSFVGLYLDDHEINNKALHHLTWYKPKFNEISNWENTKKSLVYIICPQILYKRIKNIKLNKDAKGTIFFIPHTSGDGEWSNDRDSWIKEIENWVHQAIKRINPEPPYVLCFHQTDIRNGYHLNLAKKYPIVTAGNGQDELFIDRFYYIIKHFKNSIANTVGSDLFLCHELGLNHTLFGEEPTPVIVSKTKGFRVSDFVDNHYKDKIKFIRKYFEYPKDFKLNKKRDEIVAEHIGLDSSITPYKLRKIFYKDFCRLFLYILKRYLLFFKNKIFLIN